MATNKHFKQYDYTADRYTRKQMHESYRKTLSLFAAYFVIGMIVFGWNFNHAQCDPRTTMSCGAQKAFVGIMAGIFWPLVGTGEIAIAVTRWP